MKNLHIKQIAVCMLSFIAVITFSCKKIIAIPANPYTQIPSAAVFADSTDAISAMAGVYNSFGVTGTVSITSGITTQTTALSGDECVNGQAFNDTYQQFYANAISPLNSTLSYSLWAAAYHSIYTINASLSGIQTSNGLSSSLKKQLLGELKVDRALYYFYMVNLFGPVPLVTSTDYKVTASQPRASVDSVYSLITSDLADAVTKLNASYPSDGRARPNIYTAYALLSKVYLYRGQWQQADTAASMVINSGIYSLNDDLTSVFLDGSNEAIWQLPADGPNTQTAEGVIFIPYPGSTPNFYLTDTLLNALKAGGNRKNAWVGTSTVSGKNYYFPYKYKNSYKFFHPWVTQEDYMIFRLGEILLIRSEALAQEGKLPDALADLNHVRKRAGLTNSTASGQSEILDAIMHERQTELFCEWGNRWFDLKRKNTIDKVLGTEKPSWKSTDALYPIPQAELQSNPFLKQNPGY